MAEDYDYDFDAKLDMMMGISSEEAEEDTE